MSISSTGSSNTDLLDGIISQLNSNPSKSIKLDKSTINLLFDSLTTDSSTNTREEEDKAGFKSLSIFVRLFQQGGGDQQNDSNLKIFKSILRENLKSRDEVEILKGLKGFILLFKFNLARFHVEKEEVKEEGVGEADKDLIDFTFTDLFERISTLREEEDGANDLLLLTYVELLSLSVGQSLLTNSIQSNIKLWLEDMLTRKLESKESSEVARTEKECRLLALIALTLVKLKIGKSKEEAVGLGGEGIGARIGGTQQQSSEDETSSKWKLENLLKLFVDLIINTPLPTSTSTSSIPLDYNTILPSLEGLSYLTLLPTSALKNPLINSKFLYVLFSLLPSVSTAPVTSTSTSTNISTRNDKYRILEYSIASLLANLTNYPLLDPSTNGNAKDEEEAQIFRLKSMALGGGGGGGSKKGKSVEVESMESVNVRIKLLLALSSSSSSPTSTSTSSTASTSKTASTSTSTQTNQLMTTLTKFVLSPSRGTRQLVEKIFLSLVEQQSLRGTLIQLGIAKLLLGLIRISLASPSRSTSNPNSASTKLKKNDNRVIRDQLPPFQALAKLLITTSPFLVFPGSTNRNYLEESAQVLILPLSLFEGDNESTTTKVNGGGGRGANLNLIKFECIMALTNLSSLDEDLCQFISRLELPSSSTTNSEIAPTSTLTTESMFTVLDNLLVTTSNTLLTRTTIELICNLVNSPTGVEHYSPSSSPSTTIHEPLSMTLNILLHNQDSKTLLAASGTLAGLTYYSKSTSLFLLLNEQYFKLVLDLLDLNYWGNDSNESTGEGGGGEGGAKNEWEKEMEGRGLKLRGIDIWKNLLGFYQCMSVEDPDESRGEELKKEKKELSQKEKEEILSRLISSKLQNSLEALVAGRDGGEGEEEVRSAAMEVLEKWKEILKLK